MNLQIDDSLHLFLQKTGDHLENFRSRFGYNQKFLELIMKYCKNIKFLNLYKIDNQFTHLITNLTENIKQNLNYLTIEVLNSFSDEASPILLQNLGQTLPSKLEYLSLKLCIKTNDFVTFLKNSQNTFIEKLLIMQEGNENILQCIKKYIMEEGRVKYLAFKNEFNKYSHELHELDSDLHNSKDEVKEFKSHNIIVKNHEDLCIKIYDFIREID
ncbi:hypothetical protein GLOIN_2v1773812 [Rhizophagus clarus]|nr:hypothetical protein GLOIN_2v1773812 [Rhizophagus clarus]